MAAILGAVRGVDLVTERGVSGIHECDVLIDPASRDVALVARLSAAEPGGGVALPRPDIEAVALADDPNRNRLSEPSGRIGAISSSSALPIVSSSSLVHVAMSGFLCLTWDDCQTRPLRPALPKMRSATPRSANDLSRSTNA
jgi:hypothetical protein